MRLRNTILGTAALACLALAPVDAAERRGPHATTRGNPHGQPAASAQKRTHAGAPKVARTTKPHGKTPTASAKAKAPKTLKTRETTKTAKTRPPKTSVAQRIAERPKLASRLQPLLPPGMTLDTAALGFKNQGQFIAALHVSRNLDIPFALLKTEMTGPNHRSLGQAIQELRPRAAVTTEVGRAERQANEDLRVETTTAHRNKNADKRKDRGDRQ